MCEQATIQTQSGVGEDGWHDKSSRATPPDLTQTVVLKLAHTKALLSNLSSNVFGTWLKR